MRNRVGDRRRDRVRHGMGNGVRHGMRDSVRHGMRDGTCYRMRYRVRLGCHRRLADLSECFIELVGATGDVTGVARLRRVTVRRAAQLRDLSSKVKFAPFKPTANVITPLLFARQQWPPGRRYFRDSQGKLRLAIRHEHRDTLLIGV